MIALLRVSLFIPLLFSLSALGCSAEGDIGSSNENDTDVVGSGNAQDAVSEGDVSSEPLDVSTPEPDSVAGDEDVAASTCWSGIKLCEGDGVKTCVDGVWSEVSPCAEGQCLEGECVGCTPACTGKSCGPDGCGGSCGACAEGEACEDGQCPSCVPACEGVECGPDGCGGSCGFCDAGLACAEGSCSCTPECAGKECGPDGCGGACGVCQGDFECSDAGECLAASYRAVLIQGHWTAGVGCSQYNSTGADIDAVELRGADGELISYFIEVIEEVGVDQCQNNYTSPESSIGPPNDEYMALQGGWIMGRFADYVPIDSGMSLVVHESYSAEPYSIYLATGFDCAESDDPGACSLLVTDAASGTVQVEIP